MEGTMDKEQMKRVLAGISLAGLITSVGITGTGCSKTEKPADEQTKVEEKSSHGHEHGSGGQKTEAKKDTAKSSCGQGSCGQSSCGQ